MEGGSPIKIINKKRSVSGLTPWGRCCFNFPMIMWAWGPAFPRGDEVTQNKTATYLFQTAPAKLLSEDQNADRSHYRHPLCPKCLKWLAWAGWPKYWHIWVFVSWYLLQRTELRPVPPYRSDRAWPESLLPLWRVDQPPKTCWVRWWRWELPKQWDAGPPRASKRTQPPLRTG